MQSVVRCLAWVLLAIDGSLLCSYTKMLPIQMLGTSSVFVQVNCSDKLSCTSQPFGKHEIPCESDRRCNVDRECFRIRCLECSLAGFFNPRNQIRNKLDSRRQQICHVIIFCLTAIGLPIRGHWDSGTRCVEMITTPSAFFFLASNCALPNLTCLVLWLSGFLAEPTPDGPLSATSTVH